MTTTDQLLVVKAGTDWGPSLAEAAERRYDILPYREADRIAGIVRVSSGEQEPLTPRRLLSAGTSMPDLLETLAISDPAVRLVLHCEEVVGLVSAARYTLCATFWPMHPCGPAEGCRGATHHFRAA